MDKCIQSARESIRTNSNEHLRDKLNTILSTKFRTTMIGALAQFEKYFGDIWGHGQDKLTVEQKECQEDWQQARTAILDLGNKQLREAQEELSKYELSARKYHINFSLKGREYES